MLVTGTMKKAGNWLTRVNTYILYFLVNEYQNFGAIELQVKS